MNRPSPEQVAERFLETVDEVESARDSVAHLGPWAPRLICTEFGHLPLSRLTCSRCPESLSCSLSFDGRSVDGGCVANPEKEANG